jgi:site-specific recombinase XerD
MENEFFLSLWLDTRRTKANGKFPVKLRVFTPNPRKQKLYPTKYEFTKNDFQAIWESKKPRTEFKETRLELQAEEKAVYEIAVKIKPFTFEAFEKVLFRGKGEGSNVFYHYGEICKELLKEQRFGSASSYELSMKSLKGFLEWKKGKVPAKLPFAEITPEFLNQYQAFITKEKGQSITTVGIYLRALRSVFNEALAKGDIKREIYPFGKKKANKYEIPSSSKVKKTLNKEQLSVLFHAEPANPEQEKAKAFWFFSFACQGMNIKDIAFLRYENIKDGTISFVREKTKNTTRENQKELSVPLTEKTKAIISKYGNPNTGGKQYVFPILSDTLTEEQKFWKVKDFTRFINQHMKKVAESVGLTGEISSYWARHSFATNAIRQGASMEYVSEALGHGDLKTTQGYFSGFEDQAKKQFLEALTDF